MATTTTSNISTGQTALGIYYDRMVVESLQPYLYFEQFGVVEQVPEGNYTSRFFLANAIATSNVVTLTEGTAPTSIAISVATVDRTPTQYGVNVELTDLVTLTAAFSVIDLSINEVAKAVARKIDSVIQTVVNAGTNVIYAGGKTSRAALGSGDLLDSTLILKAAQKLRKNSAPEMPGGGFFGILDPEVAHDLKSNTSAGQWIDVHKYSQPENIFRGEIGSIAGVRLVETPNIDTFTSTVTVHPVTVGGAGAYRIAYWLPGKVQTYVLHPEQNLSVSNPLGQKGSVGAKVNMAVVRTQEERLVRIECAATAL